jgi:hypothetical protein
MDLTEWRRRFFAIIDSMGRLLTLIAIAGGIITGGVFLIRHLTAWGAVLLVVGLLGMLGGLSGLARLWWRRRKATDGTVTQPVTDRPRAKMALHEPRIDRIRVGDRDAWILRVVAENAATEPGADADVQAWLSVEGTSLVDLPAHWKDHAQPRFAMQDAIAPEVVTFPPGHRDTIDVALGVGSNQFIYTLLGYRDGLTHTSLMIADAAKDVIVRLTGSAVSPVSARFSLQDLRARGDTRLTTPTNDQLREAIEQSTWGDSRYRGENTWNGEEERAYLYLIRRDADVQSFIVQVTDPTGFQSGYGPFAQAGNRVLALFPDEFRAAPQPLVSGTYKVKWQALVQDADGPRMATVEENEFHKPY